MDSPTGMAHNGASQTNMAGGFKKETDITPEYINRKMESMMAALYDTVEETEKRLKNMEQVIFELKNEKTSKAE